ncbi:peptidylprolyl isomerase SurA [Pseudidiomarina sp.]|uniref:peptidylprolyl isomerase SurA n=1 Tax=Pseudidiomarina sp. TaxID=2081707 RepID=UPI00299D1FAE|nr:peptidylprolyl isomerase SurA [Pseudidiomarina sp.]MDX1706600.1 peptidylprolyl isomerase SurA [Pseudidiomarina sp.]
MNKMSKFFCVLILASVSAVSYSQETLDRVAVVVNDGVVLESEVDQMIQQVKRNAAERGMNLPSEEVLRVQAIDRLVLRQLQLQMAERMGIQVSDAQLQQAIMGMARENGVTIDEMREEVERSGTSWANFRENIRNEITMGEIQRAAVQRRVYVSPQEINNLVTIMGEMSEEEVEYRLGHILVAVPDRATAEEAQTARRNAEALLERLRDGADFAEAAITTSSGSRALEGGDLGWMNINSMPTLFAEVIRDKQAGEIVGPIKSGVGFHILKVLDTRGIETTQVEEVKARHILIKPSVILSDRRAQEKLNEIREKLMSGEATFADMAAEHSADPGSASQGGLLDWAEPGIYADAFKDALMRAEVGEISEPFKTEFGWHIVELMDRRVQDTTERNKQNRAYQLLFSRKYQEELENWHQEIRDQAYIEQVDE